MPYKPPRRAADLIPVEAEDDVAIQRNGHMAEQPSSRIAKRQRRNTDERSWGVQARHDLRDAARMLALKRKMTMGNLVEEALIDLLRKYDEPVPGED